MTCFIRSFCVAAAGMGRKIKPKQALEGSSKKRVVNTVISIASVIVVTVLLIAPANQAFGHHLSDEMKWQLVVLSNQPACSNYHYQIMNKYTEITDLYFNEYQLENKKYNPQCFPVTKYPQNYYSPLDLDLIIIVYDQDLGREELHSQNMGGFYHHVGQDPSQNHAIVFCDCPNFYYSDPVWILTHELSHFVLTYLGYDMTIVEDLVHTNDETYDKCMQNWTSGCEKVVKRLRSETVAYSYSVMPLYELAVGGNVDKSDQEVPIQVVELSKVITKWWIQGKISEGDFSNALGFMASGNALYSHLNPEIFTADSTFAEEVTWEQFIQEATLEEVDILSRVPHNLKSDIKEIYGEDEISGLPEWFKNTASWWVEGSIPNEDFIKNVNFLRNEGIIRSR